MGQAAYELLAFNRGLISRLGLARVDMKRVALSAETMTNWMPRVLGSMMLRPGLKFVHDLGELTKTIPFIFSNDQTAIIEVMDGSVSFSIDDVQLTRPTVTAAITNGTFDTDFTGWTSVDAGTVNEWRTGGYAALAGDGTAIASISQQVTVNEQNVEHALRVMVSRGPVMIRVGSTSNGTDYINDLTLDTGAHSLAFTPTTAAFHVKLFNQNERPAIINSCTLESAGVVALTAPWTIAELGDLSALRWDQSGDIVFVACDGVHPYRIMRWSNRSWSVAAYEANDGPFRIENTSTTTLTPSGLSGEITLTSSSVASTGIFKSTHVGALFSITSVGQTVSDSFSAENDFSSHIRVTGTGESRRFAVSVSGTFVATVTLQRSFDEGSSWQDVTTYTVVTDTTYADGLDDQIVWYRIGVKTGGYTSGTAACSLIYDRGSITGVVRVGGFNSSTSVNADVITTLGGTAATEVWAEGAWSAYRGYPSAVAFHDGRLFWAGKDKFWGSVTDQFYSHDPEFEGDAGPIDRSIGYGPVDRINWLMSLGRLVAGTDGSEVSVRSSSFNEPLTPTNFTPKNGSTQGSAAVGAVSFDNKGMFVSRDGGRLYEIAYDVDGEDYKAEELTKLVPELCSAGIVALAVQRKPDTRVHCVLADGTVAVLVFDRVENVVCWCKVDTSAASSQVMDVCVLPGSVEDAVYYVVRRSPSGGSPSYYLERWALESEARGAAVTKLADSFVYDASASNVITGLDHLEGQEVVAFGGGKALGTFTVTSGSITLHASTTYTNRCAGLPYTATFKSSKLAYSFPGRSALGLKKKINHVALVLADTHHDGLYAGPSFTTMDPLPGTERYAEVAADSVWTDYDAQPIEFRGEWDTDARLCLKATAPKACTVLAAAIELETNR